MPKYNLILSASSYFSAAHAARLIVSTIHIAGDVLPVITCPREEDCQELKSLLDGYNINALILKSERRERHLCQDMGFLYCYANDIYAPYIMFADDDIEFAQPHLLQYLDKAPDFGAFGFSSSTTHYGTNPFQGATRSGDYVFNPIWIDGHNLTVKWDHALKYGLFDALPGNFNSSFVEVEIAHRYRALGHLDAVGCAYQPIIHHSRLDNVEQVRDKVNQQSVVHCGYQLWEKKFGVILDIGEFYAGRLGWNDIYNTLNKPEHIEHYKRHMILDGIWTDYNTAWEKFGNSVKPYLQKRRLYAKR